MATAPINVSGIVSGIDSNGIIDQLMSIEKRGLTRLTTEKSTLQARQSAYRTLFSKVSTLQNAAKSLAAFNSGLPTTASSTDDNTVSASSSTNAVTGDYKINIIQQATPTILSGSVDVGLAIDPNAALNSTNGLGTAFNSGAITVNGKQIAIGNSDSMNNVLSNIQNAFNPGDVTASYDSMTDKVTISAASGPILLGSNGDTSNFFSLARISSNGGSSSVTSDGAFGALNPTVALNGAGANGVRAKIAVSDGGGGAGSFTVNGVAMSFNTTTDALNDVLNRINNSSAGVIASYDKLSDRITLKNSGGGASNISVQDVTGNLGTALGLTGSSTLGQNAKISIEGINGGNPISSSDNIFTASETGIAGLTINANANTGSATITVKADSDSITKNFQTFVTSYNDVMKYITDESGVSGTGAEARVGLLHGDQSLRTLQHKMRELVASSAPGISGAPNSLSGVGVGTTGTSAQLSLDATKIASALSNNPSAFKSLTADPAGGVLAQLNTYLSSQTNLGLGPLGLRADQLQPSISRMDDSISRFNRHLTSKESQLRAKYAAMEKSIAGLQSGLSKVLSSL